MGKSVLENLINLPKTYISLLNDEKRQRLYIRNQLFPEIEEAKKTNDGSLDDNDFKKIEQYYGFGVPAILGESFCTLRGSMMTPKERKASTYQGAMTGLFDDFFDKIDNLALIESEALAVAASISSSCVSSGKFSFRSSSSARDSNCTTSLCLRLPKMRSARCRSTSSLL